MFRISIKMPDTFFTYNEKETCTPDRKLAYTMHRTGNGALNTQSPYVIVFLQWENPATPILWYIYKAYW